MSTRDTSSPENPTKIIWSTYLDAAYEEDQARPKNWEGNTGGILTFTGLFAATVAAFILEGYKQLSPDNGEQSVALLSQLLAATANASSHTPITITPPAPFMTPPSAIVTNALWFSSLLISLFCALLSTLAQQWSRDYVRDINRRRVLHEDLETRVYNHIFIRMGINRSGMDQLVSWIVALVHLSVFLFAIGLAVFLFPINTAVAAVALGVLGTFTLLYYIASFLPLFDRSCPYRTPLTYLMAYIYWLAFHSWALYQRFLGSILPRGNRPSTSSYAHTVRIHDIVSRDIPDGNEFLAPYRTTFLWECTGRHVPDESFEHMVKGLLTLPCGPEDQHGHIHGHLCSDKAFAKRLYWHTHRRFKANMPVDASLFTLVSLLSEGMFRKEVERPGAVMAQNLTSGYYVNVLGLFSRLATIDGPSKLPAQLCLANIRWTFLKLYSNTPRKALTAAPLYEEQVLGYFDNTFNGQFTLNGRHPSALLILLVLGHYSLALHSWLCRAQSVLVPLHADVCCTSWQHALAPENVAHLAACNALTMISQVLDALSTDDEQSSALLRNAPNSILVDIDKTFPMPERGRRAPSPDFVSVLRASGLEEWLEPNSDYSTEPRDGPFYKYRYYLYVNDCVSILRTLTRSVDMSAFHSPGPSPDRLAVQSAHHIDAIENPYYMSSQISPASSSLTEWSTPGDHGKMGQDEMAIDETPSLSAVVIDDHRDIAR